MLTIKDKTHRYDLPLHEDEGTGFILVLIALMAFLSTIIFGFSHGLSSIMAGWSQGLEKKITIEIPSRDSANTLREFAQITEIRSEIISRLSENKYIVDIKTIEKEDLSKMVSEWLGESSFINELPMPALLSIQLSEKNGQVLDSISKDIKSIDEASFIETHQSWLSELFTLTNALQMGLFIIVFIIVLTTIFAVAGAMKAQVEIHHSDVELLHLIGAHDNYISRQFVRHAGFLSGIGAIIGTVAGLIVITIIYAVITHGDNLLSANIQLTILQNISFGLTPLMITFISQVTTRYTVMHVLKEMP